MGGEAEFVGIHMILELRSCWTFLNDRHALYPYLFLPHILLLLHATLQFKKFEFQTHGNLVSIVINPSLVKNLKRTLRIAKTMHL